MKIYISNAPAGVGFTGNGIVYNTREGNARKSPGAGIGSSGHIFLCDNDGRTNKCVELDGHMAMGRLLVAYGIATVRNLIERAKNSVK